MTTTRWPKAISFFPVSVGGAGQAVGGVARHGNILAFLVAVCGSCLLFVCMRRHTFCSLSLLFASYVSGRAGGGWARLGYASRSPFAFVGVVAVLISCSLRSVVWHVTYLDPTSHVCMLCMFSFCLCAFLCVVLHLGGVWPPSCVLLSFVGFFVPPSCPFIPCCSSVAVMTLRRSGHVRAYLSFPTCAGSA